MNLEETKLLVTKMRIKHVPVLTFTNSCQIPKPLVIMSHGFTGKKEDLIPYLEALADMGYYAVGMDNRLHGEREDGGFETVISKDGRLNCFKLFNAIKENAEDIRALIDYFTEDPLIDITRIGMLGISMGGFTTYRAIAIDKRIKVAVPFISSPIWGDAPQGIEVDDSAEVITAFQKLAQQCSPSNTPDKFYPTAILMQVGGIDGHFDLEKLKRYYETLKSYYKGETDHIDLQIHESVAHNVTPVMWDNALLWLKRYL